MFNDIREKLLRFRRDERGFVFLYIAVLFTALAGMVGVAVDVGIAYSMRQQMQSAADAAAYSGELALIQTQDWSTEGKAVAAKAGFTDGQNNITVQVNNPATVNGVSDNNAVEVIITRNNLGLTFASLLGLTSWNVAAHAIATHQQTNYCMMALDSNAHHAFSANGNLTLGNPNCGIAVNSSDPEAAYFKGGSGTVNGPFAVDGGMNSNGNNFNFVYGYQQGVTTTDPYIANGQRAWVLGTLALKPASFPTWSFTTYTVNVSVTTTLHPFTSYATCTNSLTSSNSTGSTGKDWCTLAGGGSTTGNNKTYNFNTVTGGTTASCSKCTLNMNSVSGGTLTSSNSTYNIGQVNSGSWTISGATYNINTVPNTVTLSGTGTYNIQNLSGTLTGNATYNIQNVASNVTLNDANGTFWIQTLSSGDALNRGNYYINTLPNGVTLGTIGSIGTYYINTVSPNVTFTGVSGATYYINNLGSGVTLQGGGTFWINNFQGSATLGGNATYNMNSLPANVTLSGTGTYNIQSLAANATINGVNGATYYIENMGGGQTIDGANGGTFFIDSVTGGTLRNGIFYINTINLSADLTSTNATLVVFTSVTSNGNKAFSMTAPTTNTGNAKNAGLALVSPNAIPISLAGNPALTGAIYAPNASFSESGTVNSSCAQIIVDTISANGTVNIANDSTCGLQSIVNATRPLIVL
jgi:Flp pilus assembly protein TadG